VKLDDPFALKLLKRAEKDSEYVDKFLKKLTRKKRKRQAKIN